VKKPSLATVAPADSQFSIAAPPLFPRGRISPRLQLEV
jgi:hypothetical protein